MSRARFHVASVVKPHSAPFPKGTRILQVRVTLEGATHQVKVPIYQWRTKRGGRYEGLFLLALLDCPDTIARYIVARFMRKNGACMGYLSPRGTGYLRPA